MQSIDFAFKSNFEDSTGFSDFETSRIKLVYAPLRGSDADFANLKDLTSLCDFETNFED
jgi:hypothetical protein